MTFQTRSTRKVASEDLVQALHKAAEPLPDPANADLFGESFDRFGNAQIVLLGEATHGSSEFYRARAAITRRLIEHHGFNIVAVEADWPDAARIDDYSRHRAPRPRRGDVFARFPTWMWRNLEVLEFADWLRTRNEALLEAERTSFHGLDVYSLGESIHAVLTYLDRVDPEEAARARARYGCLTPWQDDPARYGHMVERGGRTGCEDAAVSQLQELLDRRLSYLAQDGESWFDAVQNARIVLAAERYYRAMYRGSAESWNLRDRHMFATLQALLAHRGDGARAVVWAHNSHIGNASATAMGWRGEFNIGELCRMAHGHEAVLIGFGTDRGTVAAADDWGADMRVKTVREARPDSWEHAFRRSGYARSLTDWRGPEKSGLATKLRTSLLERAIGVVYRPETELLSHYFEAVLADQFDAYVWFEETQAVTPLGPEHPHGAPETYPFGL
ncbi:erythromycin esterase-like protein [Altererythrobacter atlanticus]|uniref:Erythromycin esterase n=1 Tax=Croceibacterium atlanticum TaxID=1267766 RepID=A0A0F7KSK5_9SPHN|nr:erythromycin esterase family protein [Croceibacterium atlanticum]AKH42121.1 Erythromycin esterase [Croceibacterium atlanticum]MBB5733309.1 erythromycin esterase-like protein [Croceibacterium atlanticum]